MNLYDSFKASNNLSAAVDLIEQKLVTLLNSRLLFCAAYHVLQVHGPGIEVYS
jgi:hypothetical protein